ncbi:cysteine-rich RLK (RECEPTOR-like protein kinase)23 [Striga asiatica]|uniref:Cysteine-rich RLK (RECEPTOR-like protein kinase)23 n=1 Tax=Striga asiatica TaxID=4170 RepID=A0A5A7R869_STRAF|nr:cysteine-rich RLK (RECEPTOR-like protein kinase)23 [Striga asiatica]
MDSDKIHGRRKFSSCFNPTAAEDAPPDDGNSRRKKKKARRSLSGFMKAVFFKMPLWKTLRMKRWKRDSYRSNNGIPTKKPMTKKKMPPWKIFSDLDEETSSSGEKSGRLSLFSSTSSLRLSSISSNSSSGSERGKIMSNCLESSQTSTNINIRQHAMKLVNISKSCDCRGLMFIILVCLVALIFCGKAFAIVTCTSAWLFLAPRRAGPKCKGPRANDAEDSKEYKKRVIMEGFLERNEKSRVVP